jgi:hypothetical protein
MQILPVIGVYRVGCIGEARRLCRPELDMKEHEVHCYMCNASATSAEHAPPRCIFPRRRDTPGGLNYRLDLITVPSCDKHNCEKSADDEYLMQMLSMSLGLNSVAKDFFDSKVNRSIKRNTRLHRELEASARPVRIHDIETGVWSTATSMEIDLDRMHGVIEMNAHAIYFHHCHRRLERPIVIYSNFSLSMKGPEYNDWINDIFVTAESQLSGVEAHGKNPEVFFYRVGVVDGAEVMEFTYYGSSKALIKILG